MKIIIYKSASDNWLADCEGHGTIGGWRTSYESPEEAVKSERKKCRELGLFPDIEVVE